MANRELTLFEAAALIAGLGVGGGIMAVPYLAARSGALGIGLVLLVAFGLSLLLHLMLAEVVLRERRPVQLVELIGRHLFVGRFKQPCTWAFFLLLACGLYVQLAGYIVGCAEIARDLLGLPLAAGEVAAYMVAAGVVFFGLKAIGWIEKHAIAAIALLLFVLAAGALAAPHRPVEMWIGSGRDLLALYGMAMFSFGAWYSVPQAVEGLHGRRHLVPWAVALGLGINFAFIAMLTISTLLVSDPVTPIAMVGLGAAVGGWALALGSVVVLLAMLTSYWAFSYALAVMVQERTGAGFRSAWLVSTAPTLLIALAGAGDFLGFMRLTGGLAAVLVALLVGPMLHVARRGSPDHPVGFSLGRLGSTPFQLLVLIAYLLMAVGSLLPLTR